MTSLRDMLADAATAPPPPSGLTSRQVYATAWRRRRSRQRWAAAAVGVATVAVVAAVTVLAPHRTAGPPLRPATKPSSTRALPAAGMPRSVVADGIHLYVQWTPFTCTNMSKSGCPGRLLGSDDGGTTWTARSQGAFIDVTAPAPGMLQAHFDDDADLDTMRFSADGGRTWRLVHPTEANSATAIPAGGWATCPLDVNAPDDRCTLRAVDPHTGNAERLSTPPALTVNGLLVTPVGAGLWVAGHGPDNRGGVAVSRDGGRTWRTHLFAEDSGADGDIISLATVDGTTAYAVIATGNPRYTLVYRTTDGGQTWQATDPGHTLPYKDHGQDSYLAADGTHVVQTVSENPAEWYASNGGPYTAPAPVTGLPTLGSARTIVPTAPGAYVTNDLTSLYTSPDGLHWTRHPVVVP